MGITGTQARRSRRDPVSQKVVLRRLHFDLEPAPVCHGQRGLQKHKALCWFYPVDPPALHLAREDEIIIAGGIAAERQLEASLASKRTVAGA